MTISYKNVRFAPEGVRKIDGGARGLFAKMVLQSSKGGQTCAYYRFIR